MTLQPLHTLVLAVLVLLLGMAINRLIKPLARYNIPAPISGGLTFALAMLLANRTLGFSLEFDVTLKPVLMFVRSGSYQPRLSMDDVNKAADTQNYLDRRVRFRIREAAGV